MTKQILSRRSFIKALVASGVGLAMTNPRWAVAQSSSDSLVEELAKTAFTPLSEKQASAWWRDYRTLNFDQLELLNDLFAGYRSRASDARGEDGTAIANAFRQLRSEVNKVSVELYKAPFNQLDASQLNRSLDSVVASSVAQTIRNEAGHLAACFCDSYPYTTIPGGAGSPGNGGLYIASAQVASGCADCDWDVSFPVNRQIIKYVNIFAQGHYNQRSGLFIFRRTPTNTRVVFGYWTTLFWQGSPSYLLTGFRLV